MEAFLKKVVEGKKFELLIDVKIFDKDIVLKTAFSFLDKGYFFFRIDKDGNIIVQYTTKDGVKDTPESVIGNFSDSLLETALRVKLEEDNKNIREAIVLKAINGPLDTDNFVSLDTDSIKEGVEGDKRDGQDTNQAQNQIDFDKDIDEILREIEEDPDLKIDEEEIEKILKEIEAESEAQSEFKKPIITIDPVNVKEVKKNFKK